MTTKLTLYREYQGRRIPVVIEYDENMTIIPPTPTVASPTPKPPRLSKKVATLSKAVLDESKAIIKREEPVTPEVVEERLEICRTCDRFDLEKGKCKDCGCYMRFKARMRSQHCPQGKW